MTQAAQIDDDANFAARAIAALSAPARRLDWLSLDLAPGVFGRAAFLGALRGLALGHARAQVRLLVIDTEMALRGNERLLELARSLSSRIEMRSWPAELAPSREDWLIVDGRQLLLRAAPPSRGGIELRSAAEVRLRVERFERWWQQSPAAVALRRLQL